MPIFIVSILLQVALVVHIVKTGRNTTWIWIVVMLPLAGSIAYLIVEVLPGVMQTRTARNAQKNVKRAIKPNQDLQQAARNFSISDTVENSIALADELANKRMHEEAAKIYKSCLRGTFEYDPSIMYKLACSLFESGEYAGAKRCLDELIDKNPDYKSADGHLLYARCLDEMNEVEAAVHEYEALSEYYPGPEANYRFALMLINHHRSDEARVYLESILERADKSPSHYSVLHKEWLTKTKNLLRAC